SDLWIAESNLAMSQKFHCVWTKRKKSIRYIGTIASMIAGSWGGSSHSLAQGTLISDRYLQECPMCNETSSFGEDTVHYLLECPKWKEVVERQDRKSTRLNSSHVKISYAVFCLK